MDLKALTRIDKDDALSRIGLQTERSTTSLVTTVLTTFGVGVMVGVGVGFLLAPKSGPSMREDLLARVRKVPQDLKAALAHETSIVNKSPDTDPTVNPQA